MLQQPDFWVLGFFWFPGPDFGFRAISGPALGPYFIRALSRGEQLESKNKGYFRGGFWYPLRPKVDRISDAGQNLHFAYFFSESMRKTAIRMCHLFSDPRCSPRATGHPWVGRIPKSAQNPPKTRRENKNLRIYSIFFWILHEKLL